MVDLSNPFNVTVRVTMDLHNTLLHSVKDGGRGSKAGKRPVIPYDHVQPFNDLLQSNADVEVLSYVGFTEYFDMEVEGGLCQRSALYYVIGLPITEFQPRETPLDAEGLTSACPGSTEGWERPPSRATTTSKTPVARTGTAARTNHPS